MVEMSGECSICCEDFTKINNYFVCDLCPEDQVQKICYICVKRYILSSVQEAHCMICKKVWSQKFLYSNFKKSWIDKDYRRHYKSIIFELEKAKLPETLMRLPEIKARIQRQIDLRDIDIYANLLEYEYTYKLGAIKQKQSNYPSRFFTFDSHTKESDIKDELEINRCIIAREREKLFDERLFDEKSPEQIRLPIQPCPSGECDGLIESISYSCVKCEVKICKKCRVIKAEKHKCNSEDIETVKLLKSDTKGCPKCARPIFKISGCDQMYCVECQTAFSWNTGTIETGLVHNPHYYQYMRDNQGFVPRHAGDNPCQEGRLRHIYEYHRDVQNHKYIGEYHRLATEISAFTIPQLRRACEVKNVTLDSLREKFALGDIDESTWKRRVFLCERDFNRSNTNLEFHQMFYDVSKDIFEEYYHKLQKRKSLISNLANRLRSFLVYFDESINEELKLIGMAKPPQYQPHMKRYWK
ncbi:hypothetical protein OAG24_00390 [bacterium]|nr:hypothetical protein [bacterium]